MEEVVNCAAYKFARLENLNELKRGCFEFCQQRGLKGTVLLSREGVNLFIAGAEDGVAAFMEYLRAIPGLEELTGKFSKSARQPFRRLLIRLKKEIIAFGVDEIEPQVYTSPRIAPAELKQWLDEGREVILLDTRNDYEVRLGTFENAVPAGVDIFRDFPAVAEKFPEEWKNKPVVTFCTGGIRCEKAAPYLERLGFERVWQLDGGILKYFEDCGGAHYQGECFVFDRRVGVDAGLNETPSGVCFACQEPLTAAEMEGPDYVEGEFCPHCRKTPEQILAARNEALRVVSSPLPGSVPADNFRPLRIGAAVDGKTIDEILASVFPQMGAEERAEKFREGAFLDVNRKPLAPDQIMRGGEVALHARRMHVEPDVNADIRILHEETGFIVVNKPAPLPMHPAGRFERNTLTALLEKVYTGERLRPAHRLDANTTGLVLFARNRRYAGLMQRRFLDKEMDKIYLTRVHGHPEAEEFECDAPLSEEPGPFGSRDIALAGGKASLTKFRVLKRFEDGTSLLEARPITGRTNQIRLHLWSLRHAVVGDPLYLPEGKGEMQTLPVGAPPLCLHAWRLRFPHPETGAALAFEAVPPDWAEWE